VSQLSDNLDSRRRELGWTYQRVWEELHDYPWPEGVKPPSLAIVGHWFNGRRRPRKMEHLQGLCAVLRLSIDDAVKGAATEAATGVEQALLVAIRKMDPKDAEFVLASALHLADKGK
jgi:hypothetical protein